MDQYNNLAFRETLIPCLLDNKMKNNVFCQKLKNKLSGAVFSYFLPFSWKNFFGW